MKRTTALIASATILAGGLASIGGVTYAANQGTQSLTSATPHQIKYTLTPATGVSNATFSFPGLPPRIYNANFSITALMSTAGATINCHFQRPNNNYQLLQYGSAWGNYSTVSASGALDLRINNPIRFRCFASAGTFTLDNTSQHSSVTFVQMGTTTVRSGAASAKIAAKVSHHSATGQ
jgi:hypothetical protein